MTGRILQVSISPGGVPKRAVAQAFITPLGLEGDRHNHPAIHGGPRQAVLLICSEAIEELTALGYPLYPGALGENLTTLGLDRRMMRVGQRYQAGEAILEITKIRRPCTTLAVYGAGISAEIFDARVKSGDASSDRWGMSGFYCSVVRAGAVRQNDIIALSEQVA